MFLFNSKLNNAWNEINVQGGLANKTDNCKVSLKHHTWRILEKIKIIVSVQLFHT